MIEQIVGRIMMFTGFMIFVALFSYQAIAADLTVFDVRRNIPLSDDEPIYKDFYINGGEEAGLKKNLVIKVVRRVPLKDASGTQALGELNVQVGQLKIIHVQPHLSVARLYNLSSRDEFPMLDQEGIMSGDRIDLKESFVDNKVIKAKKPKLVEASKKAEANEAVAAAAVEPASVAVPVVNTTTATVADTARNIATTATETRRDISTTMEAARETASTLQSVVSDTKSALNAKPILPQPTNAGPKAEVSTQ